VVGGAGSVGGGAVGGGGGGGGVGGGVGGFDGWMKEGCGGGAYLCERFH
jgi:hypothetical protein